MKQLFSYYDDGEKRVYEGDAFLTRAIDEEKSARIREIEDKLDKSLDLDEKQTPPLTPLNYVLLACGFIIIAIMIYANSVYDTLGDALSKNPFLVGVLALACFAAVIIAVIDKKKRQPYVSDSTQSDSDKELIDEEDALLNEAFTVLGIPSDEEGFDVITVNESEDLGTLSAVDTLYLTVFAEEDVIVLTDCHKRYDFKKSDFKTITHLDRPLILRDAVKPFLKDLRRKYGIREVSEGYLIPAYDIVTLETEQGDYTLALPSYDGDTLAKLLGMNE